MTINIESLLCLFLSNVKASYGNISYCFVSHGCESLVVCHDVTAFDNLPCSVSPVIRFGGIKDILRDIIRGVDFHEVFVVLFPTMPTSYEDVFLNSNYIALNIENILYGESNGVYLKVMQTYKHSVQALNYFFISRPYPSC